MENFPKIWKNYANNVLDRQKTRFFLNLNRQHRQEFGYQAGLTGNTGSAE